MRAYVNVWVFIPARVRAGLCVCVYVVILGRRNLTQKKLKNTGPKSANFVGITRSEFSLFFLFLHAEKFPSCMSDWAYNQKKIQTRRQHKRLGYRKELPSIKALS